MFQSGHLVMLGRPDWRCHTAEFFTKYARFVILHPANIDTNTWFIHKQTIVCPSFLQEIVSWAKSLQIPQEPLSNVTVLDPRCTRTKASLWMSGLNPWCRTIEQCFFLAFSNIVVTIFSFFDTFTACSEWKSSLPDWKWFTTACKYRMKLRSIQ